MNKTKTTLMLSTLLILTVLLISACSKSECKINADCNAGSCFTAACDAEKCVKTAKENCCGNMECEKDFNENFCSCETDCFSERKIGNGTTMKYMCNSGKTEYSLGIASKDIRLTKVSEEMRLSGFTTNMKIDVKSPFDVDTQTFDIGFTLTGTEQRTTKPTIKRIEVKANINREERLIAERDVNRVLWAEGSTVNVSLPITGLVDDGEELSVESMRIIVYYEYSDGYGTDAVPRKGTQEYTLTKAISFVNPTFTRQCPPKCDDGNACTQDSCSADTDYFCKHNPMGGCRTNGICESSENKCTAPFDCGQCSGDYGQYLRMGCATDNTCVYSVRAGKSSSVTKVDKQDFSYAKITTEVIYDSPFKSDSTLNVKVKLDDKTTDLVPPFKIEEMRVLEGDKQLGKVETDFELSDIGDVTALKPILLTAATSDVPEFEKSLELQIDYRYSYRTSSKTEQSGLETYTISLSNMQFVKTGTVMS